MELQEVGWGKAWTGSGSGQGQMADYCNVVMNFRGFIQCGEFLA